MYRDQITIRRIIAGKRMSLILGLLFLFCGSPESYVESVVEIPVEVEEVKLSSIEEFVVATGTVNASKEAILYTESDGYYRKGINPRTSKPYAIGDRIKKDEIIIYTDNPEKVNSIKIDYYKLSLENARREYEKQKSLYDKGGVTLSELSSAERTRMDAEYSYENAEIQLEKLKVTAPFDGVIVDIPYYTESVKIATNVEVVHLLDFNSLNMEVNLPDKLLSTIKVGQNVRIMNYKTPDMRVDAAITQVSPALNPDTRTFKASLIIRNTDWQLRPGMFVKAEIITARKDDVVVIPKEIITVRSDRKTVFIINQGFARERRIRIGLENPDEAEVTDGLSENDRIVIKGYETLRTGSKVKVSQNQGK